MPYRQESVQSTQIHGPAQYPAPHADVRADVDEAHTSTQEQPEADISNQDRISTFVFALTLLLAVNLLIYSLPDF